MSRRVILAASAASGLAIAIGSGLLAWVVFTGEPPADGPGPGAGAAAGDHGPAHCPFPDAAAVGLVADHGGAPAPAGGKGRVRLCLGSPVRVVIEQDASCAWSTDRTEVAAVEASLPDPFPANSWLRLWLTTGPEVGRPMSVETEGRLAAIAGRDRVRLDIRDAGTAGSLEFVRVRLDLSAREQIDPRRDAGPSAELAGTISWQCGEAPPMDPGFSRGTIEATLAPPVAGRWSLPAVCFWVQRPGDPVVAAASTDNHRAEVGDQLVGFDAFAPAVLVYSQDRQDAGSYDIVAATIVHRTATADSSRGEVEFNGLGQDLRHGQLKLGGPGGPALLTGLMTWTCERPAGPVPPDSGG